MQSLCTPTPKTEHPLSKVQKSRRGRERGWGTALDSCTEFGRGEENKVKFSNQMAARLLSCSTGICSSKVFIFEMLQVASGEDGPYF